MLHGCIEVNFLLLLDSFLNFNLTYTQTTPAIIILHCLCSEVRIFMIHVSGT